MRRTGPPYLNWGGGSWRPIREINLQGVSKQSPTPLSNAAVWGQARIERDRAEGLSKSYFRQKKQAEAKLNRVRARRATVLAEIDADIAKAEEHF